MKSVFKILSCRNVSTSPKIVGTEKPSTLARLLAARIRSTGALTVAEFMRESLLNPQHGYYSKKDSFIGKEGTKESSDFITSPEISAVFGELIAIWVVHQMQQQNCSKKGALNLVEFGPGSGTMMSDMLRTFSKLASTNPETKTAWNVHMVEASKSLTRIQREKISIENKEFLAAVKWHDHFDAAFRALNGNDQPSVFIGHEFLDALPIHKFQRLDPKDGADKAMKTDQWREVLIDLAEEGRNDGEAKEPTFRYVLARGPTPASIAFAPSPRDQRKQIEVCPQAVRYVDRIARHLASQKCGLALFADYGHVGEGEDTFRAYSKSKQVEPLSVEPGSSDLTADVDFAALVATVNQVKGVRAVGPVTQREFLVNMGFLQRLEILLRNCRQKGDAEGRKRLMGQAEFLLSEQHMGNRFKFMAVLPESDQPVAGFSRLW